MARRLPAFIGVAAVIGLLSAGCAHHATAPTASSMGQQMQASGVMPAASYDRIRALGRTVAQTYAISDTDLDFTLTLLKTGGNPIARARAMTVLSEVAPISAAQKAKISPAVAPYLSSADSLDRVGAQRVQRALQATG